MLIDVNLLACGAAYGIQYAGFFFSRSVSFALSMIDHFIFYGLISLRIFIDLRMQLIKLADAVDVCGCIAAVKNSSFIFRFCSLFLYI